MVFRVADRENDFGGVRYVREDHIVDAEFVAVCRSAGENPAGGIGRCDRHFGVGGCGGVHDDVVVLSCRDEFRRAGGVESAGRETSDDDEGGTNDGGDLGVSDAVSHRDDR